MFEEAYEMQKAELISKIESRREEIKTAGAIHRRDLIKNLRHLQKELQDYERFHNGGDIK